MALKSDIKTAFTNNFTAAQITRIVNAFATAYGYQATINGSPNPQTKVDFAMDKISSYIQEITSSEELKVLQTAVVKPTAIPIT